MALIPEHQKYHELGPKDVMKEGEPISEIGIVRTTAVTGEQIHVNCPVFKDDSREEINDRMNMCFSIIQDRLEAENQAVVTLNKISERRRRSDEALKRNTKKYEADLKSLNKECKKKKMTVAQTQEAVAELSGRYNQAQDLIIKDLEEGDLENLQRAGSVPTSGLEEVPAPVQ